MPSQDVLGSGNAGRPDHPRAAEDHRCQEAERHGEQDEAQLYEA